MESTREDWGNALKLAFGGRLPAKRKKRSRCLRLTQADLLRGLRSVDEKRRWLDAKKPVTSPAGRSEA